MSRNSLMPIAIVIGAMVILNVLDGSFSGILILQRVLVIFQYGVDFSGLRNDNCTCVSHV